MKVTPITVVMVAAMAAPCDTTLRKTFLERVVAKYDLTFRLLYIPDLFATSIFELRPAVLPSGSANIPLDS